MDWDPAAAARLEKVPFFIRKKVKKQIEDYVQARGGLAVTDRDVTEARLALAAGRGGSSGVEAGPSLHNARGDLSAAELERIERMVEEGAALEGLNTRFRQVKVCGGAAGCPLSLIKDGEVAGSLAGIMDGAGLDRHLAGRIEGPVLFHHKFRVAVSGCPNACSQPQIADFGVIGQSRPGRGEGSCTGCGACVETCREDALSLAGEGPVFDYSRCVYCGQCTGACPSGAIREEKSGFRVLLGGKLGRHPRLAETVLELAGEGELVKALERSLRLFMEQRRGRERMGDLVERLGTDRVGEMILGGDAGSPEARIQNSDAHAAKCDTTKNEN